MTMAGGIGSKWHRLIPILTILLSLLPFLLAPARARLLTPEGRGEFAFFQSAYIVISSIGALGARHAYYAFRGSGGTDQVLIGPRAALSAATASVLAGIPLLLISISRHSLEVSILLVIVACAGPVHLFVQLQLARAQYARRDLRIAAITGLPSAWEFLSNLVLIVINSMTVFWVSALTMSTEAVRAAIAACRPRARQRRRETPVLRGSQAVFTRGLWSFAVVGVTPMLVSNVDVLAYGALLPADQLGFYAVAKLALTLLLFGTLVLEGRFATSARRLSRPQLLTIAALLCAALSGGIAGGLLIPLVFGFAYHAAAALFVAMSAVGFLAGVHVLFTARAAARQRPRLVATSSITVACLALALSLIVASTDGSLLRLALPMGIAYLGGLVLLVVGLARPRRSGKEGNDAS